MSEFCRCELPELDETGVGCQRCGLEVAVPAADLPPGEISACSSCGVSIIWAVTVRGKPMPVDVERRDDGNLLLELRYEQPPLALVLPAEERARLLAEHEAALERGLAGGTGNHLLYVSHFVTCPNAAAHRGRR